MIVFYYKRLKMRITIVGGCGVCVCASVCQVHTQIWRTFNSLMIFMANDSYLLPKRFSAAFFLSFHFISFHSVFLLI